MANLDYLFITMASASPAPLTLVVDKLISIAEYNGIEPIIIITKSELDPTLAQKLYSLYSSAGFLTFMISCFDDSYADVHRLGEFISENINKNGTIAAFAGASGVGKSTILNKFFPTLALDTSDVSRKTERGRHTTRHVELYPIDDSGESGYIADTPGFSMLDFDHFDFFDKEYLRGTFREFDRYVGECKYKKCTHTKEEGCAILEAVKCGEVAKSRHESYLNMYASLKDKHAW
jgi:ribosome biogenesis GTPase